MRQYILTVTEINGLVTAHGLLTDDEKVGSSIPTSDLHAMITMVNYLQFLAAKISDGTMRNVEAILDGAELSPPPAPESPEPKPN